MSCQFFHCPKVTNSSLAYLLLYLIPLLCSTLFSYVILNKSKWRFHRVNELIPVLNNYFLVNFLLKLFVLLPFAFLGLLCWAGYNELYQYYDSPNVLTIIILSIAVWGTIILLMGYAILHWKNSNYRLTPTISLLITGPIISIVILQLIFVFSFRTTLDIVYLLFLHLNLLGILFNSYLHRFYGWNINFSQFIRMANTISSSTTTNNFDQKRLRQRVHWKRLQWTNYLFSLAWLGLFVLTAEASFNNLDFGLRVLFTLVYFDFALILFDYCGLKTSPMIVNLLTVWSRLIVYILWEKHWFLAFSLNWITCELLIILHLINKHFPDISHEEALDIAVGSLESAQQKYNSSRNNRINNNNNNNNNHSKNSNNSNNSGGSGSDSIIPVDIASTAIQYMRELDMLQKLNFTRKPTFALTIISLVYLAYTALAFSFAGSELFPMVNLWSPLRNQYEYAFLFIFCVGLTGFLRFSWRIYSLQQYKYHNFVWLLCIIFLLISCSAFSFIGYWAGNDYLFILGLYCPCVALFCSFSYIQWRKQDYYFNTWFVKYRRLKARREREEKESMEENKWQNKLHQRRRASVVIGREDNKFREIYGVPQSNGKINNFPSNSDGPDSGYHKQRGSISGDNHNETFVSPRRASGVHRRRFSSFGGVSGAYNLGDYTASSNNPNDPSSNSINNSNNGYSNSNFRSPRANPRKSLSFFDRLRSSGAWLAKAERMERGEHVSINASDYEILVDTIEPNNSSQNYRLNLLNRYNQANRVENRQKTPKFALFRRFQTFFVLFLHALWDFVRLKHHQREYFLFTFTIFTALSTLAIGFHLKLGYSEGVLRPFIPSEAIGLFILSLFEVLKWKNSFRWGSFTAFGIVALLALLSLELYWQTEEIVYSAGLFTLHPMILLAYMALYSCISNSCKLTSMQLLVLLISALLGLSFLLILIIMGILTPLWGFLAIYIYCVTLYFALIILRWVENSFNLHRFHKFSMIFLFISSAFLACAISVLEYGDWFIVFTIIMAFSVIFLIPGAISGLYSTAHKKLLPTKYIFPVYQYKPGIYNNNNVAQNNRGIMFLLLICALCITYGYFAGLYLFPSAEGWLILILGELTFLIILLQCIFGPPRAFWAAYSVLNELPQLVEQCIYQALALQHSEKHSASAIGYNFSPETQAVDVNNLGDINESLDNTENAEETKNSAAAAENIAFGPQSSGDSSQIGTQTLQKIRNYWEWNENSDLNGLIEARRSYRRAPFVQNDGRGVSDAQRMAEIARKIDEMDQIINSLYDEHCRIIVTFQLLVIFGAEQLIIKNRARVKDFLHIYHVEFAQKTPRQIIEWAKLHAEKLNLDKIRYFERRAEQEKWAQEQEKSERRAVLLRKQRIMQQNLSESSGPAPRSSLTRWNYNSDGSSADNFNYKRSVLNFSIQQLDIRGKTLEEVKEKAKFHIEQLISQYNSLEINFCDANFPYVADLNQLILGGQHNSQYIIDLLQNSPPKWQRPSEFCEEPKVFAGEINPQSIIQGELDDCYLLSALSVLAKDEKNIKKLFLIDYYNDFGVYGVCFYVDGLWRAIFIDDQLPTVAGELVFAQSVENSELWVAILEKSYAKLYAGYSQIIGGLVHEACKDLSGGHVDEISIKDWARANLENQIWLRLLSYSREDYLLGCGNPTTTIGRQFRSENHKKSAEIAENSAVEPLQVINGIVQGHAYAILDVKEASGGLRLIKLRDPQWTAENEGWQGDFSNNSEKWTQKIANQVGFDLNHLDNSSSDGIFWMSFADFCVNFQRVYICRIFDNIVEINGNNWQQILAAHKSLEKLQKPAINSNKLENNGEILGHNWGNTMNSTNRLNFAGNNESDSLHYQPITNSSSVQPLGTPAALMKAAVSTGKAIWYRAQKLDEWRGKTAGGSPYFLKESLGNNSGIRSHPENNPQFSLKLLTNSPTIVFVTLIQPTQLIASNYYYMGLLLVDKKGKRCKVIKKNELIAGDITYKNAREISLEVAIQPNLSYTLFVSTFKPGEESKFELNIYCRQPILLSTLPTSVAYS
jgi:hypothetical protein